MQAKAAPHARNTAHRVLGAAELVDGGADVDLDGCVQCRWRKGMPLSSTNMKTHA